MKPSPRSPRAPAPPEPPPARAWSWIELAVCLALAAVAFGLYARTGGFPFTNYDDPDYVAFNPHLAQGLTRSSVAWAFSTLDMEFWHPLTWLSYLADVSLFGLRPGPMHLVNAGLHAASSVLLFVALARMTRAPLRSAIVAALFAVHPAHVESVAWISERKDVLSIFFGLLALVAYTAYVRRPNPWRLAPVVAAFAASLMAKSTLVTLPFLLLLLDAWPLQRLPLRVADERDTGGRAGEVPRVGWTRAMVEKLPLLALSIASAAVTVVAQGRGGLLVSSAGHYRPGNAIVSYVRYVGKLLWPADLAVVYPFRYPGEPAWKILAALAAIALVTVLAVRARRRAPWFTVGWLWFAGTLLPVSGIVQVGAQAMADRFTYFPSVGLSIAVVWGIARVSWPPLKRAAPALALSALAALALQADRQLRLWADEELLFRHAIAATGPNVRAHEMLANVLRNRGKDQEAYEHLQEAVRILPNPQSLTALGAVSEKLGRKDEAAKAYALALRMDPQRDEAALGLSALLAAEGREAEAAEVLAAAARAGSSPGSSSLAKRIALGTALVERGQIDEGIAVLEGVLARAPAEPEALSILSQAYFNRGDKERAERVALQAVAAGSSNAGALLVLGAVRLERGDAAGAAGVLERAVKAAPDEPFRRLLLASALAGLGRTADACAQWQAVLESPRATSEDRESAAREAKGAGCRGR